MLIKTGPVKHPIQKFLRLIGPIFIVLVSIILIIYAINDPEKEDLDDKARKLAPGSFVDLTNAKTHYQMTGPDTAQTIIMVHGFSIPQYVWNGTYDALIDQGYRVIRYDLIGRGYSDRPRVLYQNELFRNQLDELIEKLQLKKPVHLIGLSFGGAVVTDYVLNYPDKVDKIVLIDPIYKFPEVPFPKSFVSLFYGITRYQLAKDNLKDFKYPERFPNWVEDYKVQMQYRGFRYALVSTFYDYGADIAANYRALGDMDRSVQLFWGVDDIVVDYELSDSVATFLNTEVISISDAGHLPHLEQPDQLHPQLFDFLID